jgi:acetyltransferase-like isoleucine patch superfamily enzyme
MGAVVTKDVPPDVVVMGHPATVRYSRDEYEAKKKSWNS